MAVFKVGGNTVVKLDASAGGALTVITSMVREIRGFEVSYQSLDDTNLDDTAERVIAGIEESKELTLVGPYDDTATTGLEAIVSTAVGTILSFELNPIGTASGRRKWNRELLITGVSPESVSKGQVMLTVRCQPDGASTVGTN